MLKSFLITLFLITFVASSITAYVIISNHVPLSALSLPDLGITQSILSRITKPEEKPVEKPVEVVKPPSPEPVPTCIINPNDLVEALKKYSNDNPPSPYEDTLLSIISKMKTCVGCTSKETKVFLKIKMMMAIKDGNQKVATIYMKQLDAYPN